MSICFLLSRAPSNSAIYHLLFRSMFTCCTPTSDGDKKTKTTSSCEKSTTKPCANLFRNISRSLMNVFCPKAATTVSPPTLGQRESDQCINRCSSIDECKRKKSSSLKLDRLDVLAISHRSQPPSAHPLPPSPHSLTTQPLLNPVDKACGNNEQQTCCSPIARPDTPIPTDDLNTGKLRLNFSFMRIGPMGIKRTRAVSHPPRNSFLHKI